MDTLLASTLISMIPVLAVLVIYLMLRQNGNAWGKRKDMMLLLGLLSITTFYIITPDPLHIAMFLERGDYLTPTALALFGTLFLIVTVFFFKRHRSE